MPTEWVVLIVKADGGDEAIKAATKNGTIVPDHLSQIEDLTGESVLYNDRLTRSNSKSSVDMAKAHIRLAVEFDVKFKVHIFTSCKIMDMAAFNDLRQHLVEKTTTAIEAVMALSKEASLLDAEQQKYLEEHELLGQTVGKAKADAALAVSEASKEQQVFDDAWAELQTSVLTLQKLIKIHTTDEKQVLVKRIEQILGENSIRNSIAKPLSRLNTGAGPLEREVQNALASIERFIANHRGLFDLSSLDDEVDAN